MSERFLVNVEAAVYRDGEYLLIERAAAEDHAAGELALVGGTVERGAAEPALESTVRREVREEVGVEVTGLVYVTSRTFRTDGGAACVDVVFLGRHGAGEATVEAPEEVASTAWFAPAEVASHPDVPSYVRDDVAAAEERRTALGW